MGLADIQYKQTEVGRIPLDWKVRRLSECCKKITDGTHDTPKPVDIGVPYLTAIHVKQNFIDYKNCYFLPKEVHEVIYRRCDPEYGDVLMVNIGAGVATTAFIDVDYEFSLKNVALLKPNINILSGAYLHHYQSYAKQRIVSTITSGGAQPFLSLKQIGELQIALPTKSEQTAIATALSDADALIENLEKLIAKKRNIKRGVMQELLTGRKRLKGFSKEWKLKQLGKIAEVGRGRVISHREINRVIESKYPVYSSQTSNDGIMGYLDTYDFDGEYITWTTDGVNAGKVFHRKGKFNCTNVCGTIKLKSDYAPFVALVLDKATPYHVSRNLANPKLMNDPMKRIEVFLPEFEEQKAIADILGNMDSDIQKLEQKLTKYKMIKQGMMQALLTGKIRLI